MHGKTQAILVAASLGEYRAVVRVEVEVPCELLDRRLASVAAIGRSLGLAEEVDRHPCPEKEIDFGERIRTRSMLFFWTLSVQDKLRQAFR